MGGGQLSAIPEPITKTVSANETSTSVDDHSTARHAIMLNQDELVAEPMT